MGRYLDGLTKGDFVDLIGPLGCNQYLGHGMFKLPGRTVSVKRVGMLAGGTGITPMLQLLKKALQDSGDTCSFSLIDANKTQDDILVRDQLEDLANKHEKRFKLTFTLDFPPAGWKQHKKGFVDETMIRECLPPPGPDVLVLICGPPAFVQSACKANLEKLGYRKERVVAF